jgi:hypothetical protein
MDMDALLSIDAEHCGLRMMGVAISNEMRFINRSLHMVCEFTETFLFATDLEVLGWSSDKRYSTSNDEGIE